MLIQFLSWWWRQILSLAPARLRRPAVLPDAFIVSIEHLAVAPGESSGALLLRRGGAEMVMAPLRLGSTAPVAANARLPTVLRLPRGSVLRREMTLPAAAERDLGSVVGFEIDRLTPFTAEEIFWGIEGMRRDTAQKVKFSLLLTLRAPVGALLEALARQNLKPAYIEDAGGRIALGAPAAGPDRLLRYGMTALCAMLVVACLSIPFIRQQMALQDTQVQIDALRPAALQAAALRARLAEAQSGQAAIAAAAQAGDALQTLAALTDALPDGTWLTDFTLKSGDLTIDGQSSNAAKLIAVLAAAPGFHDPVFVAPVTRAMNGQADIFSIRTSVGS
jgi:general secretion pathway protein L